ncbi:MAG: hypothetical protein K5870_00865 [Lachnospiraceae bacterium]|nr:hypothetical protein [Lachnospiraceae bacterium]
MNANRNMKIDFRINGKHDHFIEPKHGRSRKYRATKPKKRFKREVEG